MKYFYLFIFACVLNLSQLRAQTIYFPPLTGISWDTIAPQRFDWCQTRIDSLYNYLQMKNTKSFIILKNGKIVLEKYFGSYTADSVLYWASSSKSLASFITGIAQQKSLININNKVSQYLGNGWTSSPLAKENLITVKNLLEMTSGLEDNPPAPCNNEDSLKACLIYKVDAGTRWAYHTGAYKKVQDVVSKAVGMKYNVITNNWIKTKVGMGGFWFDQTYYSKARDMARFGLLILNKGIWNSDTLLKDQNYFNAMTTTSQNYNPAYGYLWWLNGKTSYLNPGIQFPINGSLIPNAPSDLYCALGKNDQKIYVVPSTGMVVVRQGNSAGGVTFALSSFDNKLWDYINKLGCANVSNSLSELNEIDPISIYPNPAQSSLTIRSNLMVESISIKNLLGQKSSLTLTNNIVDLSHIKKGIYFLEIFVSGARSYSKKIVID
jgi:CubicO group peptidase (beta-lactamase class C family)